MHLLTVNSCLAMFPLAALSGGLNPCNTRMTFIQVWCQNVPKGLSQRLGAHLLPLSCIEWLWLRCPPTQMNFHSLSQFFPSWVPRHGGHRHYLTPSPDHYCSMSSAPPSKCDPCPRTPLGMVAVIYLIGFFLAAAMINSELFDPSAVLLTLFCAARMPAWIGRVPALAAIMRRHFAKKRSRIIRE